MTGVKGLLHLPAFLFSIFAFYWSLALCVVTYKVKHANFTSKRCDVYNWSDFMRKFFGVKFLRFGKNTLYKGGNCLYLCNHRSWADFFIDPYLTEGNAALMSRWMVFVAFPIFMTSVIVLKGVVLFKRGTIRDKEKFNGWLDAKLKSSPIPGLLVYPEGHRSFKRESLPLKRGMIAYAHSRQMPVQIVISTNKEQILSEKQKRMSFGVTVTTGFSEVIQSKDYADYPSFCAKVQSVWDDLWAKVYSAEPSSLSPLVQDSVPMFDYSREMRLQQLAICIVSVLACMAAVLLTWRLLSSFLLLAGSAQPLVVAALAGWTTVSMVTAWAS